MHDGVWPVDENMLTKNECDLLNIIIDEEWIGGRDIIDTLNNGFYADAMMGGITRFLDAKICISGFRQLVLIGFR